MRTNALLLLILVAYVLYSWQLAVLLAAAGYFALSLSPNLGVRRESPSGQTENTIELQLGALSHDTGLLYREVHACRLAFEEHTAREDRRRLRRAAKATRLKTEGM